MPSFCCYLSRKEITSPAARPHSVLRSIFSIPVSRLSDVLVGGGKGVSPAIRLARSLIFPSLNDAYSGFTKNIIRSKYSQPVSLTSTTCLLTPFIILLLPFCFFIKIVLCTLPKIIPKMYAGKISIKSVLVYKFFKQFFSCFYIVRNRRKRKL